MSIFKRVLAQAAVLVVLAIAFAGCTCVIHTTNLNYAKPSPVYAKVAPPAVKTEARPESPGTGWVWIQGHWEWNVSQETWVWVDGTWEQPPEDGTAWTDPEYQDNNGDWMYVPGYWHKVHPATTDVDDAQRPSGPRDDLRPTGTLAGTPATAGDLTPAPEAGEKPAAPESIHAATTETAPAVKHDGEQGGAASAVPPVQGHMPPSEPNPGQRPGFAGPNYDKIEHGDKPEPKADKPHGEEHGHADVSKPETAKDDDASKSDDDDKKAKDKGKKAKKKVDDASAAGAVKGKDDSKLKVDANGKIR